MPFSEDDCGERGNSEDEDGLHDNLGGEHVGGKVHSASWSVSLHEASVTQMVITSESD